MNSVYSLLTPLVRPLTWLLETLHFTLGIPWGWSIVVLTVIVRILIVPLAVKQIRSMQNLQRYAPQLKELQKKYAHDKQKQREELMKFYSEVMGNGYEGIMLKALHAPYRFKRTDAVLKLKPVATYEGVVVGHYEGNRGSKREGLWGGFQVLMPNGIVTKCGGGFSDKLKAAGVSRIVIERPHKKCRVTIHSARPGVVIGKKGADIEKLKSDVQKVTLIAVALFLLLAHS